MAQLPPVGSASRSPSNPRSNVDIGALPTRIMAKGAGVLSTEAGVSLNYEGSPTPTDARGHLVLQGTGLADGPTDINVKSLALYEAGTNKLAAQIEVPKPTTMQTWGGREQTYDFRLPVSGLDPSKRYTIVVNARINDSEPRVFRTDYFKPMGAM